MTDRDIGGVEGSTTDRDIDKPEIATYPEMNRKIVKLLEMGDDVLNLYAAARIRELEEALTRIGSILLSAEAALKAWEKWEADIVMCNDAWHGNLPTLSQELLDRVIELQKMRNEALGRLRA